MTGAEHYQEAERLLEAEPKQLDPANQRRHRERAQVHAILALAAAMMPTVAYRLASGGAEVTDRVIHR